MRKIALAAALALASTPAIAGGTSTRIGDVEYFSGGRNGYNGTATNIGGTKFYTDSQGRSGTSREIGGSTFYSGTTPYSGYGSDE